MFSVWSALGGVACLWVVALASFVSLLTFFPLSGGLLFLHECARRLSVKFISRTLVCNLALRLFLNRDNLVYL